MTYRLKQWFAITISPPPYAGNQFYKMFEDQKYFKLILKRASNHYIFWPEFDKMDRLHYHGIIRIDNQYSWYKSARRKFSNVGYTHIKKLHNFTEHLRWLMYCTKEWFKNKPMIDHYNELVNKRTLLAKACQAQLGTGGINPLGGAVHSGGSFHK